VAREINEEISKHYIPQHTPLMIILGIFQFFFFFFFLHFIIKDKVILIFLIFKIFLFIKLINNYTLLDLGNVLRNLN
jgi:hypothetical protein